MEKDHSESIPRPWNHEREIKNQNYALCMSGRENDWKFLDKHHCVFLPDDVIQLEQGLNDQWLDYLFFHG